MERYVYICDGDSSQYFNDNTPYKFKVQLKTPLNFDGYWKVSLRELSLKQDSKLRGKDVSNTLFIYSNICKESILNGSEYALLRRVDRSSRTSWQYIFESPFYLPLKRNEFQELEFVIKTADGKNASFIASPVYITLHFKRYPFYSNYESV